MTKFTRKPQQSRKVSIREDSSRPWLASRPHIVLRVQSVSRSSTGPPRYKHQRRLKKCVSSTYKPTTAVSNLKPMNIENDSPAPQAASFRGTAYHTSARPPLCTFDMPPAPLQRYESIENDMSPEDRARMEVILYLGEEWGEYYNLFICTERYPAPFSSTVDSASTDSSNKHMNLGEDALGDSVSSMP
jgi:hypothetical protein